MKPFIRYYGGKFRAAPRYPKPEHDHIIEPFAGAAGYACRYPQKKVTLIEKYPKLAEMWRYLTSVSERDVLRIPNVVCVDDLPSWVPDGGRTLVGFWMNDANVSPCKTLSAGRRQKLAANPHASEGWCDSVKTRIASQLTMIRHWRVVEGDYTEAPDIAATWFIDPPYNNRAGSRYVCGPAGIDYNQLADFAKSRKGQVIVCENEGAQWLPFVFFGTFQAGINGQGSREVIWTNG